MDNLSAQATARLVVWKKQIKQNKKRQGLPGMPIGWVHLDFQPQLDELVAANVLKIVQRPAVTNPARMAKFVVEA